MTFLLLAALTIGAFACFVLVAINRTREAAVQSIAWLTVPPPPPSGRTPLLSVVHGVYLGTTAGDRLVDPTAGAQSASARLTPHHQGVLIDRDDSGPMWIDAGELLAVRSDAAHAGRFVGPGGAVVVTWARQGERLESGFRAGDTDLHGVLLATLGRLVAEHSTAAHATPFPEEPGRGRRVIDLTGRPSTATPATPNDQPSTTIGSA